MKVSHPTSRILNAKSCTSIATWNVRTLNSSGKLANAIKEMNNYKIDILGLCETRWKDKGEITSDGVKMLYSGNKNEHIHGVGLLLNKEANKTFISWEPISERLLTARFNTRFTKLTIIQCYAPTNSNPKECKDEFYHHLQQTIDTIPKHDMIIMMGDFNAQISESRNGFEETIGPFGSGKLTDNGERLLHLCLTNEMKIMNTFFKHKRIHKTTWTSPDGETKNEIEYICVNKRWAKCTQDVRVKRGADIGSDHELLTGKIKMKLKRIGKKTVKKQKFDINKLHNHEFKEQYAIETKNRFNALVNFESGDIEDQWNMFKDALKESAKNSIGIKRGSKKESWISDSTWELIDERKKVKSQQIQSDCEENRKKYKMLDKLVKTQTRKDKQAWLDQKTKQAQEAANMNNTRAVYQIIKELSNNTSKKQVPIKSKNGTCLKSPEETKERWIEHFSSVLNQPNPKEIMTFEVENDPVIDIDEGPILSGEVAKAISKLKNNKAPGSDGIHPEMLKHASSEMMTTLTTLLNTIWKQEKIPEEWKTGTIIPLPKKGDLSNCSNWRGITLLSLPSKVLTIVILNRIRDKINSKLRDEQSGFRPGRSCTDAIFALRNIINKTIDCNMPVYLHFIDFQKAFDSIHRDTMWKIVKSYGIPTKLINVMKAIYEDTKCCIRVGDSDTRGFKIETGVRQGCILSPFLFILTIDFIMKKEDSKDYGVKIGEEKIFDLAFADDIALLDSNENKLQECTNNLKNNAEKVGLRFNAKKCEVMSTLDANLKIKIDSEEVKKTEAFTYLGSKITECGKSTEEIKCRIGKAGAAFGSLNKIMRARNINLRTKMGIYNATVLSILLYGSETWTLTKVNSNKLDAFHHKCLRKILGISYRDRITNRDILNRTQQQEISEIIRNRRLRWFGHVVRMRDERFPKKVLSWEPTVKRGPGRPRYTWKQNVTKDLRDLGTNWSEAMVEARDRDAWRRLTAQCTATYGRN